MFFEPTDVNKAAKITTSKYLGSVTYASPNLRELHAMVGGYGAGWDPAGGDRELRSVAESCRDLLREIQVLLVTLGEAGVMVVRRGEADDPLPTENDPRVVSDGNDGAVSAVHYPVELVREVASVSGAGDCLAAGFVASLLKGVTCQDVAVSAGIQASRLSLADLKAVPFGMTASDVDWERRAEGRTIL